MTRSMLRSLTVYAGVLGLSASLSTQALATGAPQGSAPAPSTPSTPSRSAMTRLTNIAQQAYVYGYPLVLLAATKRAMLAQGGQGEMINTFRHSSELATPSMRELVRPSVDTLYSTAVLDLSNEPVIMHVPDTNDRYYVFEMLDAFTNVFAAPGKRTTGTMAKDFAIVGPEFQGTLPANVTRIEAPTNHVWIIGRIQVNGQQDLADVQQLQQQFRLSLLSQAQGAPQASGTQGAQPSTVSGSGSASQGAISPVEEVENLDARSFFQMLAQYLREVRPLAADADALARFRAIGLIAGEDFAPDTNAESVLEAAKTAAKLRIARSLANLGSEVNGWRVLRRNIGTYGTNYLRRAVIAKLALGANRPEDAVYPFAMEDVNGRALDGSQRYVIHFDADKLPPVNAFWSITLYDTEGHLVSNAFNKFAIRDRDPLVLNADGSLDLFLQPQSPGGNKEANWLPTPVNMPFNLLMRLYWPNRAILNGTWEPAGIVPAEAAQTP